MPETSAAVQRVREVALQQMIEQTARDRIMRARKAHTRVAAEQLELKVGQEVEYWRDQADKDVGGWRGPAVVTDLTRLEHGRVGLRTMADR
eukprot:6466231-Amphidinium_carterae.1